MIDGAAAGLAHRRQAVLHRQKHAIEIDRSLPPPVGQRHLGDRRHGNADAGVRNQHVEPAIALHDVGHDLDPALLAGHIVMPEGRLSACLLDPCCDFGAFQIIDVGDCDGGALARQQFANRLADAGRAARYQCDLALNLPCHFRSFLLLLVGELILSLMAPDRAPQHRPREVARAPPPESDRPRASRPHAAAGRGFAPAPRRVSVRSSGTRCR